MKLSDYRKKRLNHHMERDDLAFRGKRGEQFYSDMITEDVAAAEAAGVVWDPEEEPLPKRLTTYRYGQVPSDASRPALYPEDGVWKAGGAELAGYGEAVRRYNAVTEVLRMVDAIGVHCVEAKWVEETLRGS